MFWMAGALVLAGFGLYAAGVSYVYLYRSEGRARAWAVVGVRLQVAGWLAMGVGSALGMLAYVGLVK